MATLLINQEQLTQESPLNENMDYKLLRSLIKDTQEMYIQPVLGSKLYRKILGDVATDTLAGAYLTLVNDYVRPCHIAYVMSESPDYLLIKFLNKGIMTKNSENSNPIDDKTVIALMERWRDKAQWLATRITNYLRENCTSFPEYEVPDSGQDAILPNKQNYTGGIFLDDPTPHNRWGIPPISDRSFYEY